MADVFISTGNTKLAKDGIASFNLVAGVTCPGKGICATYCYAQLGHFLMKDAKRVREENEKASKEPGFALKMSAALRKLPTKFWAVRLHDSGDFYSQKYLNLWVDIMRREPSYTFYCYTKSLHLDWSEALTLQNFHRIQSIGGRFDKLINPEMSHSRIFENLEDLKAAGYEDASHSDIPAATGRVKIGLVIHGARQGRFHEDTHLRLVGGHA